MGKNGAVPVYSVYTKFFIQPLNIGIDKFFNMFINSITVSLYNNGGEINYTWTYVNIVDTFF